MQSIRRTACPAWSEHYMVNKVQFVPQTLYYISYFGQVAWNDPNGEVLLFSVGWICAKISYNSLTDQGCIMDTTGGLFQFVWMSFCPLVLLHKSVNCP